MLYTRDLMPFPAEAVERAARQAIRTCRFFPSIAEMVEGSERELAWIAAERNRNLKRLPEPEARLRTPEEDERLKENWARIHEVLNELATSKAMP